MNIIKGTAPPAQHTVPLTDIEAWHRHQGAVPHLFDRMWLARAQGLLAHPHGIRPVDGDWLSKPIVNLAGMGAGLRPFTRWTDALYEPGHFWMARFGGTNRIEDYVLVQGSPVWRYVVDCETDMNGTILSLKGHQNDAYDGALVAFVGMIFPGYTGVLSMEIVQEIVYQTGEDGLTRERGRVDRYVDLHLRPCPEFLHFYGADWLRAVEQLYADPAAGWSFAGQAATAMVIPIRIAREMGAQFEVDMATINQLDCAYLALDFQPGESVAHQPNDPWTWRLALVGDTDQDKADKAAMALAKAIQPAGGQQVARMRDQ